MAVTDLKEVLSCASQRGNAGENASPQAFRNRLDLLFDQRERVYWLSSVQKVPPLQHHAKVDCILLVQWPGVSTNIPI